MSAREPVNIDQFPEQCRRLGSELAAGARMMAVSGLPALAERDRLSDEIPVLTQARVRLRLYFGKRQDSVVLFFFKETGLEDVLLDAMVEFEVRPALESGDSPPLRADLVELRMAVPPCFPRDVEAHVAQPLLERLHASPRDVLFIAYERGLIAVNAQTREIAWPGSETRLGPHDPAYLWPLLAISRSIGGWISGEAGAGGEFAVSRPQSTFDSDFDKILQQLTEAWCSAVNHVEGSSRQKDGPESLADALAPDYFVRSYKTELAMRLDGEGRIVFADDEDLFRLEAAVDYRQEEDQAVALIDLRPPDFLLSGKVYRSLLGELAKDKPAEKISRALEPAPGRPSALPAGSNSLENVRAFIASAQEKGAGSHGALVFRIKRGRRSGRSADTDVFVLTGRLGDVAPVHLILKAKVRVAGGEGSSPREAEILDDGFEVLSCSHVPMAQKLDEVTGYFSRLFGHLQRWYRVTAS